MDSQIGNKRGYKPVSISIKTEDGSRMFARNFIYKTVWIHLLKTAMYGTFTTPI
jgi:hypothetical protein